MNERRQGRSGGGVRVHARADLPTRHAVTAALMAGFFLTANGLALAWTLTDDDPYMRRGSVVVMIAISMALFPVVMWGLFRLPRLAVQLVELVRVHDRLRGDDVLWEMFMRPDAGTRLTRFVKIDR